MKLLKIIFMLLLTLKLGTSNKDSREVRMGILDRLRMKRKETFFVTPRFEMNSLTNDIKTPKPTNLDDNSKDRQYYNQDTTSIETNNYENADEKDKYENNYEYDIHRNINDMMEVLAKQNELVDKLMAQRDSEINKKKAQIQNTLNEQILRRNGNEKKEDETKNDEKKKVESKLEALRESDDDACVIDVTCISPNSNETTSPT